MWAIVLSRAQRHSPAVPVSGPGSVPPLLRPFHVARSGGRSMGHSLGQAAKAAARSKTTMHRAIASGRLSATRAANGGWSIDPAELARVFPADRNLERSATDDGTAALRAERDRLLVEHEDLRETIRDLRTRLDAEADERRRVQERLTGLLTHRQTGSVPTTDSDPAELDRRREWSLWRRLRWACGRKESDFFGCSGLRWFFVALKGLRAHASSDGSARPPG
jgi:hypothetical protein